jgi:hypothetical protein
MTYTKPNWKIEVKTGDTKEPYPEWIELRGYHQRFRYVDREEAEHWLAKLRRIQPHGTFRVAPV